MANQEHRDLLRQGADVWNRWRMENPEICPDLVQAELSGVDLNHANLSRAELRGASLSHTNLGWADLRAANLSGADLYEALLVEALLGEADLQHANLIAANLTKAILSAASLAFAEIRETSLSGADLTKADLRGASLRATDLSGARLHHADLRSAVFISTDLEGAYLTGAVFGGTLLADLDLSKAQGLDSTIHQWPSMITLDAICLSKGNIPASFLRGCGVPDECMKFTRSLVRRPAQYHSCSICHSAEDKDFAERLYADLQAHGVRTWYVPEDVTWSKTIWGAMDRSVRTYDRLVVVCSTNSLQSRSVLQKIERALEREYREHKNGLFPIALDDYIFDEWKHHLKAEVLAKVVGDFRGWDASAENYDAAFQKLLQALQAEAGK